VESGSRFSTHHLLHPLSSLLAPQQETTTSLEQKSGTLDVGSSEIVDESLVDVKDGVRLSDLELGELAVVSDVLFFRTRERGSVNDPSRMEIEVKLTFDRTSANSLTSFFR